MQHRLVFALAGLLLSAPGCEASAEVVFQIHTDLVPGVSFDQIEVTSIHGRTVSEALARDYRAGVRLDSISVPPGQVEFEVSAVRAGRVVLTRTLSLPINGRVLVPVWLLFVCRDARCPSDMDPAGATECEGGRCVAPECSSERPDLCPAPACTSDGDCPTPSAACGQSRCTEGLCVVVPRPGSCAPDETCDPSMGCVTSPATDAGVRLDAGPDGAIDVGGMDGGAMDAGSPEDLGVGVDAGMDDVPSGVDAGFDAGFDAGVPIDSGCPLGRADCNRMSVDGCEVDLSAVTTCGSGCPTTDCTLLPNVATATCASGACGIATCDPGFANCNLAVADGCETNLDAVMTCGPSCGSRVNCTSLPNVNVATCSAGACGISSCDAGFGDCSGGAANGCETTLFVPTACGSTCGGRIDCTALPGVATATCPAGACGISTCDPGVGNCDASTANGCETPLNVPSSCGPSCAARVDCPALPNVATTGCSSGSCTISACDPGFADCSGGTGNGCETNLTSTVSCGSSCGSVVNCTTLPNVSTTSCSAGSCGILTCRPNYGNCDGMSSTGCEVNFRAPNTCGTSCGMLTDCNALPNVTLGACLPGGACDIATCDVGFFDCDSNPMTGCEETIPC